MIMILMEPGAETSDSIMIRFEILQMFFHRWYIMAGWEKMRSG